MTNDEAQYIKMTATPIPRLVVSLALPTVMSMMVTALYNTADTFFVSRLGTSASAAVGVVFSLMAIFQAIGFTLGTGAGSLVSLRLGAKDVNAASKYLSTSFFAALFCGGLFTLYGLIDINHLMRMLGSTPTILPYSRSYAAWILLGAPVMCASFVMNNVLRSEGKAAFAMAGLVTGGFINIGLDPLFIFTFKMGIAGAAIATLVSQCIGFAILISFYLRGRSTSKLSFRYFSTRLADFYQIVRLGFPSLCRQGLASIATVSLIVSAAVYGDATVAAMSIVGRIFFFILALVLGIGQGFMPVAGYNYGAGKFGRVREAVGFTIRIGVVLMVIMSGLGIAFAPQVIAFFRNDPDVIRIGAFAMRLQCAVMVIQPIFVTTNMSHQSTGHAAVATFLACNKQGLYFLPLIFLLPKFFGLAGVQMAQPVADIFSFLTCLPFLFRFLRELRQKEKATACK